MRLVLTADLHGTLPEIPECDVLVIAGDICPDYFVQRYASRVVLDKGERKQRAWLDTTFREWLESVPARRIYGIAGNHDYVFEHAHWLRIIEPLPWVYLQDDLSLFEGVKFYGRPWVPNLPAWAFYGNARALQMSAAAIPEGVDVLINHGPPFGVADDVAQGSKYGNLDKPWHVGDQELELRLTSMEQPPKLVVCGHIHEGYGRYELDGIPADAIQVHNVSHNDEKYNPINPPVVIEL